MVGAEALPSLFSEDMANVCISDTNAPHTRSGESSIDF
jgi:hypothetical protein